MATLARQYAEVLSTLSTDAKGQESISRNFFAALKHNGHEKLLPAIVRECERLDLGRKRLAEQKKITPEQEQTRILTELYRKLTDTHHE